MQHHGRYHPHALHRHAVNWLALRVDMSRRLEIRARLGRHLQIVHNQRTFEGFWEVDLCDCHRRDRKVKIWSAIVPHTGPDWTRDVDNRHANFSISRTVAGWLIRKLLAPSIS